MNRTAARSPIRSRARPKSDKVKVAVRVRPSTESEHSNIEVVGSQLTVCPPQISESSSITSSQRKERRTFAFDRCFAPKEGQSAVYTKFGEEFLTHAMEGYNACVFAYGQTGSGKSHTMLGNDDGLIPQLCMDLFRRIDGLEATTAVTVRLSFLEIYNEQIRDLLAKGTNLRLRGAEDGAYVEGLSEFTVKDVNSVIKLLRHGTKQRSTAATVANDQSSRSHAVITLQIKQHVVDLNGSADEKVSQLRLVDLAGSERAGATGATGDRLREGSNINASLVTLGRVISTLAEHPNQVVPYRDSVLTRLLQNSLGGNSRTAMIACVSPGERSFDQTLSTLRYADQAKRITTRARINHDLLSSDAQAARLATMEHELNELRTKLAPQQENDIGTQFAAFARFYEEEAAKQHARCRLLEIQKAAVEDHNRRMTDYVRELTGQGLSMYTVDSPQLTYEDIEQEHGELLEEIRQTNLNAHQSVSKWREILASV